MVGGGFICAEVAASASQRGVEVRLIEWARHRSRACREKRCKAVAELHSEHGVTLRCGVPVVKYGAPGRFEVSSRGVDGSGRRRRVVGLGVRPNTEWLDGSGIAPADGIICDDRCVTSVPGIVAAGTCRGGDALHTGTCASTLGPRSVAGTGGALALSGTDMRTGGR